MKLEYDLRTQLSFSLATMAILLRMASDWLFRTGGPPAYQILQAILLALAVILISPKLELIFLRGGGKSLSIKRGLVMLPVGLLAGLGIAFMQSGGFQWPGFGQSISIITNNLFFPAVEELEFRGFFLGWMILHRVHPSLAIWLIAGLHTLAHPHYIWQGNYVFFLSILLITAWFGWLTARYRSLWGAYIAHALFNISLFLPMAG